MKKRTALASAVAGLLVSFRGARAGQLTACSSAAARSTTARAARPTSATSRSRATRSSMSARTRRAAPRGRSTPTGKAVSPGFINMLSWATESLIADGRGLSDTSQGVTLEVMGEGDSMGPLNAEMKRLAVKRAGRHQISDPLDDARRISRISAAQGRHAQRRLVRRRDHGARARARREGRRPDARAARRGCARWSAQAMKEGALGVGSSLIYAPATYAETPELIALTTEAGEMRRHVHQPHALRGEQAPRSDRRADRDQPRIGRAGRNLSLQAGRQSRTGASSTPPIARVEAARADGQRITADMYTYTAGATGLDAAMPPWVQAGGLEAWIERLKDPAIRARLVKEMRTPSNDWENLLLLAGQPGQGAAGRLQEPEAEAAHRQDARRGREDARQEPRRDRDGPGHRGRQPRRHRLFPDERGQCEARGRACRG